MHVTATTDQADISHGQLKYPLYQQRTMALQSEGLTFERDRCRFTHPITIIQGCTLGKCFVKNPNGENKIGIILLIFAVTIRNHCTPSTHAYFVDHICTRVGVGMFTHPGNMHLPSPVKHCFLKHAVTIRDDIFSEGE